MSEDKEAAIRVESVENAYCDNCFQPKTVSVIRIKGWDHRIKICEVCIGAITKEVSARRAEVLKREG